MDNPNKSFSDRLRERREFVTHGPSFGQGGGDPAQTLDVGTLQSLLSQRIAQGQQNEQLSADKVKSLQDFLSSQSAGYAKTFNDGLNGKLSGGVPMNPQDVAQPISAMTQSNMYQLAGARDNLMASQNQTNGAASDLSSFFGQQQSHDLGVSGQKLQAAINGLVPDNKGGYTYGDVGTDPAGKPVQAGPQAINQVIKQGGKDILDQAPDEVSKRMLAASVLATGGVGNYRKQYADTQTPEERNAIAGSNQTLSQINNVINHVKTSKTLTSVMGDPVKSTLANWALNSKNTAVLHAMGLTSDDISTLSDMTALGASGERVLVGGRLSGYLVNRLGSALPSLDKQPADNLEILNNAKSRLTANLQSYAKQKGYKTYTDIPGIQSSAGQQRPSLQSFITK